MATKLLRRQTQLQQLAARIVPSSSGSVIQSQLPSLGLIAPPLFEPGCAENCKARDLRAHIPSSRASFSSAAAVAEVAQQESTSQESAGDPHVYLTPEEHYSIEFFTGDVRGAGTPVPATIRLVGTEGESQDFILGDDSEEPGFRRGEAVSYELRVDKDLGDLRRVFVRQVSPDYCYASVP